MDKESGKQQYQTGSHKPYSLYWNYKNAAPARVVQVSATIFIIYIHLFVFYATTWLFCSMTVLYNILYTVQCCTRCINFWQKILASFSTDIDNQFFTGIRV